ncbi:MAG: hypothetical protein KatS3mg110_2200 [Pirellulaceae bacterium]|nr:MAG: hypothetical protein KatS3mg110_2200 [Pirellulaceae bacterium]
MTSREVPSESVPADTWNRWQSRRRHVRVRFHTLAGASLDSDLHTGSPRRFVAVETRDLSMGGVSFYSPEAPTERAILLQIGPPDDTVLILARISRCERDFDDPQRRFLIGCAFERIVHRSAQPMGTSS